MAPRLDYRNAAPEAIQALRDLQQYVDQCGLDKKLLELVKLRASQINGCAYCVDMHTKDARACGETEQRLYAVAVWREAPFFNARERAALAWTESVTLLSQTGVPDEIYQAARAEFSEKELVNLTLAVLAINSWNRLAVSFRAVVGTYRPAAQQA